jgi:hypothetical protein
MVAPPVELGAVKATLAMVLPTVTAPIVGAPGAVAATAILVNKAIEKQMAVVPFCH